MLEFKKYGIIFYKKSLAKLKGEKIVLTLNAIREIAIPIAKEYGIAGLYLLGSYARGDADENSDLDFRVDRPTGMSLFELGGLQYRLSEAFHCHVDLVTTGQLSPEFRKAIQNEEVTLYES